MFLRAILCLTCQSAQETSTVMGSTVDRPMVAFYVASSGSERDASGSQADVELGIHRGAPISENSRLDSLAMANCGTAGHVSDRAAVQKDRDRVCIVGVVALCFENDEQAMRTHAQESDRSGVELSSHEFKHRNICDGD
ncbi:MAG: hypothetical protein ABMA25_05840 [Ilumatobacteraceae bacterium]